jgi:hypothetical protein
MKDELESGCGPVEVLFRNLRGGSEENDDNLQSRESVSLPRCETSIALLEAREIPPYQYTI